MPLDVQVDALVRDLFPTDRRFTIAQPAFPFRLEFSAENYAAVLKAAVEDLRAYVERDPALMGEPSFALVPNSPFVATLCHRLAHWHWQQGNAVSRRTAMAIAHLARSLSGAEIHPGAQIGKRFVLDHGTNTVIGATCIIGDDCYLLNGVILGARGISGNPNAKRHPTIGDRVQIGSFVRILGDVRIGNDAFIGPHSVITRDVAAASSIRMTDMHSLEGVPFAAKSSLRHVELAQHAG